MIDDYVQFKDGYLTIEANWNETVKPAQQFRFTMDTGKEKHTVIVKREHIFQLLSLFATEEQMETILPVQSTQVERFDRLIKIRAKKDVKKGEIIAFPYTYFVPTHVVQKIVLDRRKEIVKKKYGI